MAFTLTDNTLYESQQVAKEPIIVLKIDGVNTLYGSGTILKRIRIGDEDLLIGDDWEIGGINEYANQAKYISLDGSTTSINQQLDIEKGRGSSISSMEISLIDFNSEITELVSPGVVVADVLGRKCKVYLGFAQNTTLNEDYIIIFRGIIDNVLSEQGRIKLNISSPDQKKRNNIFSSAEGYVNEALDNSETTITVDNATNLLLPIVGPSGGTDTSFTSYIRVDDEIIKFTGISTNDLTTCTRAQLATTAAAHDNEADWKSFYRLEGNGIDLALKIMLSGWEGAFVEDVDVTNYNATLDGTPLTNIAYFSGVNIELEYGLTVGDYFKSSGATNAGNNISTWSEITAITVDDNGSYIEVDGVTFVEELGTAGVCQFRSQYDVLPSGCKMSPDEVDIEEHLRLKSLYLSSFDFDFYLKDTITNAQEFIEKELYKPMGAYSLPRKTRSSLGFFVGPLPGIGIKILDEDNVTNPQNLKTKRSLTKNFANTIVYKYEIDALEDKFLRGVITTSATSLSRIDVGQRALVIEAKGMREDLNGQNLATAYSNRRLDRYKFGAEFIDGIDVTYEFGFNIEIGDIISLDGSNLNLIDTTNGIRGMGQRYFEIINKKMDIKRGKITLDLLDTSFDTTGKYGLISPSSRVISGASQYEFTIDNYYSSVYGANEYRKWNPFSNPRVKVRSSNFTTRFGQSYITNITTSNVVTVSDALGFTPQSGDVMELADYDFTGVTDEIKLLYVHLSTLSGGDTAFDFL